MTNLTALETHALNVFETNYKTAEDEKEDNATYMRLIDIVEDGGMTTNVAKGVIGSLVKKNLVSVYDDELFILTDEGIDALYEL